MFATFFLPFSLLQHYYIWARVRANLSVCLVQPQVRHLEETGGAFAHDLIQKSAIIQAYAMETRVGELNVTVQSLVYV